MELHNKLYFKSALNMSETEDESVSLIVTSPPYPMIQMWDDIFSGIDGSVGEALEGGNGAAAWGLMHRQLDSVWAECFRVLRPGGFACINIGDATRKVDGQFRLYSNHSRIISAFTGLGFDSLPAVIWRKPTNAPNKFMGSGMLPAGAYVTLEHEYILIFRKGGRRTDFSEIEKELRRKSAYFWEERNSWFSDIWQFKGASQLLGSSESKAGRQRSGAYPLELVHRLINMYSFQQDRVVDPFLGTGTTLSACMLNGRAFTGYEIDGGLESLILENAGAALSGSGEFLKQRLERHREFIEDYTERKGSTKYRNREYGFSVVTRQEQNLCFPVLKDYRTEGGSIICNY